MYRITLIVFSTENARGGNPCSVSLAPGSSSLDTRGNSVPKKSDGTSALIDRRGSPTLATVSPLALVSNRLDIREYLIKGVRLGCVRSE